MSLIPIRFDPSPNFNSRGGCKIDQIIIHDCQGSYKGSEAYFDMRASNVSAHFIVREDGLEIVQQVDIANRAWHACNFNSRSIGIEMAGYAEKGFSASQLGTTARLVRYLAAQYSIPLRHAVGGAGPGIETHYGLGVPGGRHFDPDGTSPNGKPDPTWMPKFMALVAASTPPAPGTWEALRAGVNHPNAIDLGTYAGVQRALNALGATPPLDVDNEPGSLTERAIAVFQNKAGLKVDGVVGPATIFALTEALAGTGPQSIGVGG